MKKVITKKLNIFLLFFIISIFIIGTNIKVSAKSFMSDKTEITINLDVSGAEALCQTDDGFVWIAQYSGLTRYDSKDFITYNSFTYLDHEYSIINVRSLASNGNTVYIGTSTSVYKYEDHEFSVIESECGIVVDIALDKNNGLLYVSTQDKGGLIYDINTNKKTNIPNTIGINVDDIAIDEKRNSYYYDTDLGVFDKDGVEILANPKILDIYIYDDILYMGETGVVHRYNLATKAFLDDIVINDQVNRLLYSDKNQTLFAACEGGLFCVDLSTNTPAVSQATGLENSSQLIDLMLDYEGNLWIASHYIGASGVSIITKNSLYELLFDDETWQSLDPPPTLDRNVYAVERFGNILYIVAASRIYLYDLNQKKILPDNVIMETIDNYVEPKPRDVEVFNGKIYFAVAYVGLVEYDTTSGNVKVYDSDYISNHLIKEVNNPDLNFVDEMRALRSFDNYLAIGYSKGIMKFDGENFSIMNFGGNVLYLNKTNDGKLIIDRTKGIHIINDDFEGYTTLPTDENGNSLKFLIDGNYIYYTSVGKVV